MSADSEKTAESVSEQDATQPAPQPDTPTTGGDLRIVGIGASAGGLEALEALFHQLPADSDLAFIVIQHLSPDFKSVMDELLARHTRMKIYRVQDDMSVEPNSVYLIPPRSSMVISDGHLRLHPHDHSHGLNLPIDIFFESLAKECGERAIGVVLSGTGSDGTRGVRRIKEVGGVVIAQDLESAKFDGMPRSVTDTGLADFVLPPNEIATQLVKIAQAPIGQASKSEPTIIPERTKLERILRILRKHHMLDFSHYKTSTVSRRIERRMGINHMPDLDEYIRTLDASPVESKALAKDLLIGVTQFFRDPDVWRELSKSILPEVIEASDGGEPIRAWVPACSTGEEAYSLAMVVRDALDDVGDRRDIKIFATDVDPHAIEIASAGIYPDTCAADIDPQRLQRYFHRSEGKLEVSRDLRQMVVFACQNVLKDPPFTKLDLVTCRNLLIYLQPDMQQRLISLYHFALNPHGYLVLGLSETVGECKDAFKPHSEKLHIYRKNPEVSLRNMRHIPDGDVPERLLTPLFASDHRARREPDTSPIARAQEFIAERFAPPGVLLNEQMQVIHSFGDTTDYLHLPGGAFTPDVSKMIAKELQIPLQTAVQRALRKERSVSYKDIALQVHQEQRLVDLEVAPLPRSAAGNRMFLAFFKPHSGPVDHKPAADTMSMEASQSGRINDLEQELHQSKENLQATIEELETTNEELQSTNEELLASNEELQSTNEELHSVNEELYTVNAELQSKISELTELNEDFDNLLKSTEIGVVFLDRELRIRRFTPKAQDAIHLVEHDVGRPISHFSHNLSDIELVGPIKAVIESGQPYRREVCDNTGHWYLMRIRPFLKEDDRIEGAVITLVDVAELKENELALQERESQVRSLLESTAEGIAGLDTDGRCRFVNAAAVKLLGFESPQDLIGERFHDLALHLQPDGSRRSSADCGVCKVVGKDAVHHEVKDMMVRADGSSFSAEYWAHPIKSDGKVTGTVVTFVDNSQRDQAIEALAQANLALAQSNQELEQFASIASHDLQEPLRTIRGYLQLVRETLADKLDDRSRDHLERINNGISRLQALISDLLKFSRITAAEMERGPVDMQTLTSRVVSDLGSVAGEHDAEIVFEGLPTVHGNGGLLGQLLQNLIGNAIKYCKAERPMVKIAAERQDGMWRFAVQDNGIGIKPEHQGRIFQIFRRLHAPSEYSGTGVGLAIAKKIVERHTGRIWVESETGQGSTFYFTLPGEDVDRQ